MIKKDKGYKYTGIFERKKAGNEPGSII